MVIVEAGIIRTEFGEVLMDPMLKRSGNGPYSKMAHSVASATRTSYEKGGASDPQVIVDLILKVVRADKPKTRYAAGKHAKPMMFIRKRFGDRMFDRMALSTVK